MCDECGTVEEDESERTVDRYYQRDVVEICWSFSQRRWQNGTLHAGEYTECAEREWSGWCCKRQK